MVFHFAIFITCIVNIVLVSGQTYVCENTEGNLHCPAGKVINITSASYGRDNATICSTNSTSTANCTAQNITAIIAEICNGVQDCTMFYRGIEDPCPNVTKYLTVNYVCSNISVTTCGPHEFYSSLVCNCLNQCQTPDYACNQFCSFVGGCVCNPNLGYRKDPITGKCVGEEYCPQGNTTQTHEVFSECASRQRTCPQPFKSHPRRCIPGYQCAPGRVRDVITSQCVVPDECPRPFARG